MGYLLCVGIEGCTCEGVVSNRVRPGSCLQPARTPSGRQEPGESSGVNAGIEVKGMQLMGSWFRLGESGKGSGSIWWVLEDDQDLDIEKNLWWRWKFRLFLNMGEPYDVCSLELMVKILELLGGNRRWWKTSNPGGYLLIWKVWGWSGSAKFVATGSLLNLYESAGAAVGGRGGVGGNMREEQKVLI